MFKINYVNLPKNLLFLGKFFGFAKNISQARLFIHFTVSHIVGYNVVTKQVNNNGKL